MTRAKSRTAAFTTVSVASYNIHRCIGIDRRHDPTRIAAVLKELNVDAIALQEVDAHYHVERGLDQLDFLARTTGLEPVEGTTLRRHNARYGNGLLTRHPISDVERLDLSVPGRERRGGLNVLLNLGSHAVRIVSAHFGLRIGERRLQSRRLLDCLAHYPDEPLIVLGDFNEWRVRGGALIGLERALGSAPLKRTFPSWGPMFALDRVWVRPANALVEVRVHATRLARIASDHLPIRATIHLPR